MTEDSHYQDAEDALMAADIVRARRQDYLLDVGQEGDTDQLAITAQANLLEALTHAVLALADQLARQVAPSVPPQLTVEVEAARVDAVARQVEVILERREARGPEPEAPEQEIIPFTADAGGPETGKSPVCPECGTPDGGHTLSCSQVGS